VADVVEGGADPAKRDVGQGGPGQPVGGQLDGHRVLLRLAAGRLAGLPVHHVEAAVVGVGEHRVDPAADLAIADEHVERDLSLAGPPAAPFACLEPGLELDQVLVRVLVVPVGEQVVVVDQPLLAEPLLKPQVERGTPACLAGGCGIGRRT
jgi:hypothetical protein